MADTPTSEEPKPCPFCETICVEHAFRKLDGHVGARIECPHCGCIGPAISNGASVGDSATEYAAAVAAWNRRQADGEGT